MLRGLKMMKVHRLLAAFLFPIIVVYIGGGALYTLGVKGEIKKESFTISLKKPFEPNLELLTRLTAEALHEKMLALPRGEPVLTRSKRGYKFQWSDLKNGVTLLVNKDNRSLTLHYRQRTLLTRLMRIHRGEAGTAFKLFSLAAVLGLLTVFMTGLFHSFAAKKERRSTAAAIALGILTFFLMIFAA